MSITPKRILFATAALVAIAALVLGARLATHGAPDSGAVASTSAPSSSSMRMIEGPLGEEAAVALDLATRQRAGIESRVIGTSAVAGGTRLAGELAIDPGRITTIQSAVSGRLLAASGHWPALGERVAAGSVLGQVSDAREIVATRAGTVTRVGAHPGEIVQAGQELLQLTDFDELLARIVWRPGAPRVAPPTLTLAPLDDPHTSAAARLVGAAPGVDSLTRFPVYLYRVSANWPGARSGAPVIATLPRTDQDLRAAFVPADAVVQWEGLAWAFIEHRVNGNTVLFVRRRVDTSHPVPGGWLLTSTAPSGIGVGDTVVVRGAQELLSEEFRSRLSVGDEDDET